MGNPYETTTSTAEERGEDPRYSLTVHRPDLSSVQFMTSTVDNPRWGTGEWEELRLVRDTVGEHVEYMSRTGASGVAVPAITPAMMRALAQYSRHSGTPEIDRCEEGMIENLFNLARPLANRTPVAPECPAHTS